MLQMPKNARSWRRLVQNVPLQYSIMFPEVFEFLNEMPFSYSCRQTQKHSSNSLFHTTEHIIFRSGKDSFTIIRFFIKKNDEILYEQFQVVENNETPVRLTSFFSDYAFKTQLEDIFRFLFQNIYFDKVILY